MGTIPREDGRQDSAEELSDHQVSQAATAAPLAEAVSRAPCFEGYADYRIEHAIDRSCTIQSLGVVLAWMLVHASVCKVFPMRHGMVKTSDNEAKRTRFALPLTLGELSIVVDSLLRKTFEELAEAESDETFAAECWTLLSIFGVNSLHSRSVLPERGPWHSTEARAVSSIRRRVAAMLKNGEGVRVQQTWDEVDKELKAKRINYTGEELLHCHPLTLEQILPALPPKDHGGCVKAVDWVGPLTKRFLLNPHLAVAEDVGQELPKLQGKIHIPSEEVDGIVATLIERNVCAWVPLQDVMYFRGQPVLNGLFGVEKPARTASDKCVLRLIMNLVPTNSVLRQLTGGTSSLPSISQWQSLVLEDRQQVKIWQSDMSSAFYLFALPRPWWGKLAFNVLRSGSQLGLPNPAIHALCCRVIPMGFNSSVALMQEISENLLLARRLPREVRVGRGDLLPRWMTAVLDEGMESHRAWYHVYLDNFCAGARVSCPEHSRAGDYLHGLAETAWREAGVVSSEKKRKSGVLQASELGSFINGETRTMGVGVDRILKLAKASLWVMTRPLLNKKSIQIVAGRWVHAFQFRRPAMSCLDITWRYLGNLKKARIDLGEVRREIFRSLSISPLLHTDLGASVANFATASDASSTGGAVSISRSLTTEGQAFVHGTRQSQEECQVIPVLVLSLFNGIGGALRSYDVLGLRPAGVVICDISKEANRVSTRRWPNAEVVEDIRSINKDLVQEWLLKFTQIQEIHIWGGFPCNDLSSAKAGRLNLAGPKSGLFYEIPRVVNLVKFYFGGTVVVKEVFENVASMDKSAVEQISFELRPFPYFMDPVELVPMHRPRLCWTTEELDGLFPDVSIEKEASWRKVSFQGDWPQEEQWVTPGWVWGGQANGVPLPTCMRTVPKAEPPPFPAGLARCDADTVLRWRADDHRVPPYQYREEFLFFSKGDFKWRRPNAQEKELLLGYGWQHTSLCLSASRQKQSMVAYEDCRQSLLGDSFSVFAFALPCAGLCRNFVRFGTYWEVVQKMGAAPGFTVPFSASAPIVRGLSYGFPDPSLLLPHHLNRELLRRVNHTGSDIRVATGLICNPKSYPRQSSCPDWWRWKALFRTRWKTPEHINCLELRAIFLALKHAIGHLRAADMRLFHISDSYICLSIVAKGRTSSIQLNRILKQFNAHLLAFGLYWIQSHVESFENPTDEASRQT